MVSTKSIKLVMVGDTSVGKTSLLTRYVNSSFSSYTEATIGASFFHKIEDNPHNSDESIRMEIWDTAGQERYRSLLPMYYRNANIVIMVYDVTNPLSFSHLSCDWIHDITNNCRRGDSDSKPVIYLVGNKIDLNSSVTNENIQEFANNYQLYVHKVSAKTGKGISELFKSIVEQAIQDNNFNLPTNLLTLDKNENNNSKCC